MKKILFPGLSAVSAFLLVLSPAFAMPERIAAEVDPANPQARTTPIVVPANAVELAPNIYSLGSARDVDGRIVEGIMYVHKRNGANDRSGAAKGKPGGTSTCYSFLASGARWKVTEPFLFNPTNTDGLDGATLATALTQGTDVWDNQVTFDLFGSGTTTTTTLVADTSSPDNVNEVYFNAIADPNTIAVTTTWGIFGGPPQSRQLVEWDMVFNTDFTWGDATLDSTVMDFRNIAVHELGHAAGLGHPSDSCVNETMYRFGTEGETKKRDLNTGDIAGIKALYK